MFFIITPATVTLANVWLGRGLSGHTEGMGPDDICEAVVVWTGWRVSATPARDDALVFERFGDSAADLIPLIHSLADEFYESEARHRAVDLTEMQSLASQDFRPRHPEISEDAVRALAWCYTWDYK